MSRIELGNISVELTERGQGRPILFLHPGHPAGRIDSDSPVLELLAKKGRVIAPTHPGFGMEAAPPELTTIDDLAYLYLDLLEAMDLRNCAVVGVSLGGWIAAEMAVKTAVRMSHLVLADALGIKVGSRETRDIADIYAVTDKELADLVYADAGAMAKDVKSLPEDELILMARARESTGRYGWTPYMHDPKLKQRLRRIHIPTLLLWGEADRVAGPDYGRAYAAAIPGARFETIPRAGHFPHLEQPAAFVRAVSDFIGETQP